MDFAQYLKQQTSFLFIMKKYITEYANYLNNNQLTKLYIQAHSRINKTKKPNFNKFFSRHNEAKKTTKEASATNNINNVHHVALVGFAFGHNLLNKLRNKQSQNSEVTLNATSKKVISRIKRNPNGLYDYELPSAANNFKAHLVTPDDLIAYLESPKNIEHYMDY